ncbi:unnamed protein product [Adineta steineri]|uniref:Receptor expression-enhancing protein n=1 Tax=Adineta steineri TaxID=433720 RepID=A0A820EY76_9BILA|nr:unnamed protein product [Adineta steineri]
MAAVIRENIDNVKNKLDPYLHSEQIDSYLKPVEEKIRLERSLIVLGLFPIVIIYMIFGGCNDFVCNFIGILYPICASLSIVKSSEADYAKEKELLIYWIVYSSLISIEYIGYNQFHALRIYWLVKLIFLIWFINYGAAKAKKLLEIVALVRLYQKELEQEENEEKDNKLKRAKRIEEEMMAEYEESSKASVVGVTFADEDMILVSNVLKKLDVRK